MLNHPEGTPRAWWWGFGVAVVSFTCLTAIGLATRSFGYAFVVGAPFVCGLIIGRWVRVRRVLQVLAVAIAAGSVIAAAIMTNLAGIICGMVFGWIAALPLLAGVWIGSALVGEPRPRGTALCVAIVAIVIPLEHAALPPAGIETVRTTQVVDMDPMQTFSHITFFEDVRGTAPRLLRIALPRPIMTVGDPDHVGGHARCIYDTGYIEKEITAVEPGSYYAFRVTEQVGVESHAVMLRDGSFRLTPVGRHRTRVILETTYTPRLGARIVWRPFEVAVIHALHRHVLRAMVHT